MFVVTPIIIDSRPHILYYITVGINFRGWAFLWLNKSGHTSSSVKICIFVTAVLNTSYLAESVHVATGKQETVKEAQVAMQ